MDLPSLAKHVGITVRRAESFLMEFANLGGDVPIARINKESVERFLKKFPEFFPKELNDPSWVTGALRLTNEPDRLDNLNQLFVAKEDAAKRLAAEKVAAQLLGPYLPTSGWSNRIKVHKLDPRVVFLGKIAGYIHRLWGYGGWTTPDIKEPEWIVFLLRLRMQELWRPPHIAFPLDKRLDPLELWPDRPLYTPFDLAMLYLSRNVDKSAYCRNRDCQSPYFFIKKKGQAYCGRDCADKAQQERARRWWAEHGKQWRKERNKK